MKSKMQHHFHNGKNGVAIAIRVIPRAKRNEIVEILNDGTIKIRLTAPPVEGKANQALLEFLADVFNVAKSKIEIVAGEKGRKKLVSILDMDAETAQKIIEAKLSD